MATASVYLNFPGTTLEAMQFYADCFKVTIVTMVRYADMPELANSAHPDLIAHAAVQLTDNLMIMATDVPPGQRAGFVMGNNTYLVMDTASAQAAVHLFDTLAWHGKIDMPLAKTSWAQLYGVVTDQFGVNWMVSYGEATT